ncbi:MAG: RagB/SusD family nutrient uptake outer membrane protein [Bacteroidia bacterium]|nr:RagB/SusD family nutrient uptake outer membrane protein [Bacteroidia bacterium]
MKARKYILALFLIAGSLSGCNDDFMNKFPETSLSPENFFNTVSDLEVYTNNMYGLLSYSYDDVFSDNISIYTGGSSIDNMLRGKLTPDNVGGWTKSTWGTLYKINFMLAHLDKVQGTAEDINHFVGIARLHRARFYYGMVKTYGDVPLYSQPLGTGDTELLYKGRDSRAEVVDFIMADLDFAAKNIKAITSRTKINKYAALQELARVALYEGTYRKYHSELKLESTANAFFDKALAAANEIITSKLFEITGNGAEGYRALFVSGNLAPNKEMILYRDFDKPIGVGNNSHTVLNWQWSLSRALADSYLKIDGTSATSDPGYYKKGFIEMFADRDPRMAETFVYPNFIVPGDKNPTFAKITFGGLAQLKFYPREVDLRQGWNLNYTDLPIYRYAETLLIYAETKAELGTINQADLDLSINKLRDRVNMPHLKLDVTVDPFLEEQYPLVNGDKKAVLLEIRRERRVELACEGFRYDDVKRWGAGRLLEKSFEGIYIPALGAIDLSGDGEPDIAVLESPTQLDPISNLTEDQKKKLVYYYLKDKDGKFDTFYLSEGDKGNVRFRIDLEDPKKFETPKYYYLPLPYDNTSVNN